MTAATVYYVLRSSIIFPTASSLPKHFSAMLLVTIIEEGSERGVFRSPLREEKVNISKNEVSARHMVILEKSLSSASTGHTTIEQREEFFFPENLPLSQVPGDLA